MTREELLTRAKEITVDGRRNGEEDIFADIAKLWSTYTGMEIGPNDVCMMMILLKVARVGNARSIDDSLVDIAGYAACAAGVLEAEANDNS